jgi:hypothetical protein
VRYYCKNCGSVIVSEKWSPDYQVFVDSECPLCGVERAIATIPDYETIAQYEKRTGEPYPDMGLVWYRVEIIGEPYFCEWHTGSYKDAKEECKCADEDGRIYQMVIADPPVPPPDDWKPE